MIYSRFGTLHCGRHEVFPAPDEKEGSKYPKQWEKPWLKLLILQDEQEVHGSSVTSHTATLIRIGPELMRCFPVAYSSGDDHDGSSEWGVLFCGVFP